MLPKSSGIEFSAEDVIISNSLVCCQCSLVIVNPWVLNKCGHLICEICNKLSLKTCPDCKSQVISTRPKEKPIPSNPRRYVPKMKMQESTFPGKSDVSFGERNAPLEEGESVREMTARDEEDGAEMGDEKEARKHGISPCYVKLFRLTPEQLAGYTKGDTTFSELFGPEGRIRTVHKEPAKASYSGPGAGKKRRLTLGVLRSIRRLNGELSAESSQDDFISPKKKRRVKRKNKSPSSDTDTHFLTPVSKSRKLVGSLNLSGKPRSKRISLMHDDSSNSSKETRSLSEDENSIPGTTPLYKTNDTPLVNSDKSHAEDSSITSLNGHLSEPEGPLLPLLKLAEPQEKTGASTEETTASDSLDPQQDFRGFDSVGICIAQKDCRIFHKFYSDFKKKRDFYKRAVLSNNPICRYYFKGKCIQEQPRRTADVAVQTDICATPGRELMDVTLPSSSSMKKAERFLLSPPNEHSTPESLPSGIKPLNGSTERNGRRPRKTASKRSLVLSMSKPSAGVFLGSPVALRNSIPCSSRSALGKSIPHGGPADLGNPVPHAGTADLGNCLPDTDPAAPVPDTDPAALRNSVTHSDPPALRNSVTHSDPAAFRNSDTHSDPAALRNSLPHTGPHDDSVPLVDSASSRNSVPHVDDAALDNSVPHTNPAGHNDSMPLANTASFGSSVPAINPASLEHPECPRTNATLGGPTISPSQEGKLRITGSTAESNSRTNSEISVVPNSPGVDKGCPTSRFSQEEQNSRAKFLNRVSNLPSISVTLVPSEQKTNVCADSSNALESFQHASNIRPPSSSFLENGHLTELKRDMDVVNVSDDEIVEGTPTKQLVQENDVYRVKGFKISEVFTEVQMLGNEVGTISQSHTVTEIEATPASDAHSTPGSYKKKSRVRKKKKKLITYSSLNNQQVSVVQLLPQLFNVELSTELSDSITHVIIGTMEDGKAPRTLKYLMGIAKRCIVLTYPWVEACLIAKRLVPEVEFIAKGEGARKCLDSSVAPPFTGFAMCHEATLKYLKKEDLEKLLILCGAKIVPKIEDFQTLDSRMPKIYLFDCDTPLPPYILGKLKRLLVLPVELHWIFESIEMYKPTPLRSFLFTDFPVEDLPLYGLPTS